MSSNTIYILDGGVFSPPTKAVGKLAYNISNYVLSKNPSKQIRYHFLPTNKYYNKPWVRCVSEEDRLIMLDNLVKYINSSMKVSDKIKFIVDDWEIKWGKKHKAPSSTIDTLTNHFTKKQLQNLYLSVSIDNIVQTVKGNRGNGLQTLYLVKYLCYDIFSSEIIGDDNETYIYKSIDLPELLRQANNNYPKEILSYFKKNKITKQDIDSFITFSENSKKFDELKSIIMKRIDILPKHIVPENYKAMAGNRVREELDVFYSSMENLEKFTTPATTEFITKNKLYHHCKSTYQSKLVSKKKTKKRSNKKSKSKSNKSKSNNKSKK